MLNGIRRRSWLLVALLNVLPLFGVLFLHYTPFELVWVYFTETIIVGLITVAKMATYRTDNFGLQVARFFLIPFFMFHYNMFAAGQSIFLKVFEAEYTSTGSSSFSFFMGLERAWQLSQQAAFLPSILAIALVHCYMLAQDYFRSDRYRTMNEEEISKLMFEPYQRIFVQQIVVIAGAFLFMTFKAPNAFLLVLIALKTFLDLRILPSDQAKGVEEKGALA